MSRFVRVLSGLPALLLVAGLVHGAAESVVGEKGAADEGFGGVGLQVVPTIDGELVVLNVLAGSPAAAQGLQPGDLLYRVDDFPLRGSDFGQVIAEHLWGPVGTELRLFYRRPGFAGDKQVRITRAAIDPRLTVTPAAGSEGLSRDGGQ